jgi:hypothetical protein
MIGRDIVDQAFALDVLFDLQLDGRLLARGKRQALEAIRPLVKQNKPAVIAALREWDYSAADLAEFDALIDRLAAAWYLAEDERRAMRERRLRMAPCRVRDELVVLREQVAAAEALRDTIREAA